MMQRTMSSACDTMEEASVSLDRLSLDNNKTNQDSHKKRTIPTTTKTTRTTTLALTQYEALCGKTCQLAAVTRDSATRCQLVAACASLFTHAPPKVVECLQQALKIADGVKTETSTTLAERTTASSLRITLFLDLLEVYHALYVQGVPTITIAYLQGLLSLLHEHLEALESTDKPTLSRQYRAIVATIALTR